MARTARTKEEAPVRKRRVEEEPAPRRSRKAAEEPAPRRSRKVADEPAPRRSRKAAEEPAPKRSRKVADEPAPRRSRKAVDEPTQVKKRTRADADEPAAKGRRSKAAKEPEASVPAFNPYGKLDAVLDDIEKHIGLSESSMDTSERRLSTGMLMLDIVLGGGLTAGWYTNFGQEQTCKTTGAVTILSAALNSDVPILGYWDYEGSATPEYIENIMRNMGAKADVKSIFGVRDEKTGKYIVVPRVRYKSEGVAEKFFDYVAKIQRMLPDKKKIGDNWYYIYEDTKENRAVVGKNYDVNYWRKTKRLRVPAKDGSLQCLILVDSYPAMLPETQDVDDPNNAIATQARMFSDQLKRVKGKMKGKRMAVLGINQLRLRPMVAYGCLHGSIKVEFVDGRVHTMREIVERKIRGDVWSMNEATNNLEPKAITAWHYNGEVAEVDDWVKIVARNPMSASGFTTMVVTKDHEIYTQRGWIAAKKLRVSDKVLAKTTSLLNGKYGQFLAGSLSADSTLVQDCKSVAYLRLQDNDNPDYLQWKLEKLSSGLSFTKTTCGASRTAYCSNRSQAFASLKATIGRRDPTTLEHSPLSLAIIYMDDGHLRHQRGCTISFKRFKNDAKKLSEIRALFASFGVYGEFMESGDFRITKDAADVLFALIRRYVPSPMQYKLPDEHRGFYKDFTIKPKETVAGVFVEVAKIETGTPRLFRHRGKYDISVADNANYLAGSKDGGIIVHNSPEYEPCGEALKLYSDVRLKWSANALSSVSKDIGEKIAGKGQIEEESSIMMKHGTDNYRYIKVRGHKNKLSRPYLECWLRLWITDAKGDAQGFDPVFDTYMYLLSTGQVEGKRAKMRLKFKGNEASRSMSWMDFKRLILGDRATVKSICQDIGMKPVVLRDKCFAQMAAGTGIELYNNHAVVKRAKKAEKRAEDADAEGADGEDDND